LAVAGCGDDAAADCRDHAAGLTVPVDGCDHRQGRRHVGNQFRRQRGLRDARALDEQGGIEGRQHMWEPLARLQRV
jgi:hypothetical protein